MKTNSFLTKLNDSPLDLDTFVKKNFSFKVKLPPLVLASHSDYFNELLSWKRCFTINQLCTALFNINQKRFRKIIQKHLLYFEPFSQSLFVNESSWLFFYLSNFLFKNKDDLYHYLRELSLISVSSQYSLIINQALTWVESNPVPAKFIPYLPNFLNILLIPNPSVKDKNFIKLLIRTWSYPNFNYQLVFKQKSLSEMLALTELKINLYQHQNFSLVTQSKLNILTNHTCLDSVIWIPQTHHDLLLLGEELHLCLSYSNYPEKILKGFSNLICLKKDSVFAIIEVTNTSSGWKIIQAKKFFNYELEDKYKDQLLFLLNSSHLT